MTSSAISLWRERGCGFEVCLCVVLCCVVDSNPYQLSCPGIVERSLLGVVDLFALPCLSTSLPSC